MQNLRISVMIRWCDVYLSTFKNFFVLNTVQNCTCNILNMYPWYPSVFKSKILHSKGWRKFYIRVQTILRTKNMSKTSQYCLWNFNLYILLNLFATFNSKSILLTWFLSVVNDKIFSIAINSCCWCLNKDSLLLWTLFKSLI